MSSPRVMLFIALCLQVLLFCGILAAPKPKQPNIVFVLADDYGWSDVGYHGNSGIKTPNMDALAYGGVRLENYYVQTMCSPTRTSLLSGRYTIHTGLGHFVILNCQHAGLPPGKTLADRLKSLGYSTHGIGKWHAGFYENSLLPTNRGFDSFFGFYNAYNDHYTYRNDYNPNQWDPFAGLPMPINQSALSGIDLSENGLPVSAVDYHTYNGTYSTDLITQKALDLIEKHGSRHGSYSKPLFLYLPLQVVHYPMQVPASYLAQYTNISSPVRKLYAGMVATMDEAIGKITQSLKDNGMWDNTVFIFSSDNGGHSPYGGFNYPLRGEKGGMYDGGMKAVGFVASPLLSKKVEKTAFTELMHVTDWYPTLVGLAGGNTKHDNLDGVDQWKAISKGDKGPRSEIVHLIDPLFPPRGTSQPGSPFNTTMTAVLRVGDWKIITGIPGAGFWKAPPENAALVPLVPDTASVTQNVFLYNIKSDPSEMNDRSATEPAKVNELLARLAFHKQSMVPMQFGNEDFTCDPRLHGDYWVPFVAEAMPAESDSSDRSDRSD